MSTPLQRASTNIKRGAGARGPAELPERSSRERKRSRRDSDDGDGLETWLRSICPPAAVSAVEAPTSSSGA
eukprot:CAMPEP_0182580280 /NCGR_PEP_ID=MMETSP1324-20130603/46528_1 /TAXON_ID=236786 /ORGANISM="Florenciella sp., Strain RCC1587" /LENGTH=70 /DNA_ID=CAMNT_0024796479 /DNA_START=45 /DNA_END=253 /DNA_ORIENTATION=+